MIEQKVVIHSLRNNICHNVGRKLDECVVLASACFAVAGEAKLQYTTELFEVLSHFVLVETMGDVANVYNTRLFGSTRFRSPLHDLLISVRHRRDLWDSVAFL